MKTVLYGIVFTCLARSCLFLRNQLSLFLKSGSFWMTSSSRVRQAKRGIRPTIERTRIAMLRPGSLGRKKERDVYEQE